MKSFLVVGLGRFGRHLARKLTELGNEVMVVDQDEELVARMASAVTAACVGDCQDEQVLESLGVRNFDICFVCVRDDFHPEGAGGPVRGGPGGPGEADQVSAENRGGLRHSHGDGHGHPGSHALFRPECL